jgi:hypothetical protein
MKPEEGPSESRDVVALARLLATAAAGDTLIRDFYLGRARALLEPTYSEARYRSALDNRAAVHRLLAQSRTAVGRQDWAQVEELATRAAQLRSALAAEENALVAAAEVYGADAVALDPFSRGLAQFAKTDAARARNETLAALERLARDDREQHDLYVARSRAIAALAPAAGAAQEAPEKQGLSTERRALAAVEREDAAELARLAQDMRAAAGRKEAGAAAPGAPRARAGRVSRAVP